MKKKVMSSLIEVLSIILLSVLVSAADYSFPINDLKTAGQNIINVLSDIFIPFLQFLLGEGSATFFSAKVLLLLLLFIVIFTILKRISLFERKKAVCFLVAAIVSILAIRYIPENEFFEGILVPYGALGIAIVVFLPFLIYFFFVHLSVPGNFGRRAAWAVFALAFLVLWALRAGSSGEGANALYLAGISLVILAFIFDKSLHRYFGLWELSGTRRAINDRARVRLWNQYNDARRAYDASGGRDRAARRVIEETARQLNINAGEGI